MFNKEKTLPIIGEPRYSPKEQLWANENADSAP